MPRYGMVIDLNRCMGCHACAMACKAQNATPLHVFWSKVLMGEAGTYPNSRYTPLPVLCNHCDNPPCMSVCPVGATTKQPDGIVVVDYDKCIGCGACVQACPYDARTILPELVPYYDDIGEATPFEQAKPENMRANVAQKCIFCKDLVAQGEPPACVKTCPCSARHFGDLDDTGSEVSRLIKERKGAQPNPELGTGPCVYYLPSKVRP